MEKINERGFGQNRLRFIVGVEVEDNNLSLGSADVV